MVVAVVFMLVICFFWMLSGFLVTFLLSGQKSMTPFKIAVSGVYCILTFATLVPLFHGILRWFWYLGIDKKLPVGEVFYIFSDLKVYAKSLYFYLLLIGKSVMLFVVSLLPAAALRILPELLGERLPDGYGTLIYFASNLLLVVGIVVAILLSLKYFLAPVIFLINEELAPEDAIVISADMKLSKSSCVGFYMSFLGWAVLSLLGLPLLYTLPYYLMSYVVAVRFAVTNHRYDMARWGLPPLI